jgi:hypothetical protein
MADEPVTLDDLFDQATPPAPGRAVAVSHEARRLALAIIQTVIEDLASGWPGIRAAAHRWIVDADESPCGLRWCADAIDVEPERIAGRLLDGAPPEEALEARTALARRARKAWLRKHRPPLQARQVLDAVLAGSRTSAEVAAATGLPLATCSAWLSVLVRAGHVSRVSEGAVSTGRRGRRMNVYGPPVAETNATVEEAA